MLLTFAPQGGRLDRLDYSVEAPDVLLVQRNGGPVERWDLSGVPEGGVLPRSAFVETEEGGAPVLDRYGDPVVADWIASAVTRAGGQLQLRVLLPFLDMAQPERVWRPEPVEVTEGRVPLPTDPVPEPDAELQEEAPEVLELVLEPTVEEVEPSVPTIEETDPWVS